MSIFFYFFNISQKPVDVINLFFQNRQQWRVQIIDHATHLQALEQADVREGFKVHGSGLPFGDTPLLQEAGFAIGQLKKQFDQILGIDLGGLGARQGGGPQNLDDVISNKSDQVHSLGSTSGNSGHDACRAPKRTTLQIIELFNVPLFFFRDHIRYGALAREHRIPVVPHNDGRNHHEQPGIVGLCIWPQRIDHLQVEKGRKQDAAA